MPANTVYVGRPTKWGNPFAGTDEAVVNKYRALLIYVAETGETPEWLWNHAWDAPVLATVRDIGELRGKDLACWCRLDQPCHADVLLEFANNGRD